MSRLGRLAVLVSLLLVVIATVSTVNGCFAAEFTADLYSVRSNEGPMRLEGKVYVKGNKIRVDAAGSQCMTVLVTAPGKAVCVDFTRKIYRYLPETPQITVGDAALRKIATAKTLGVSKVSGYTCTKVLYTFKKASQGTQIRCYSSELRFPLRVEQRSGKKVLITELRNIKRTKISDSTFQIPSGFKELKNTTPPPRKPIMAPVPKPKM